VRDSPRAKPIGLANVERQFLGCPVIDDVDSWSDVDVVIVGAGALSR
jgi:hypothetical protein